MKRPFFLILLLCLIFTIIQPHSAFAADTSQPAAVVNQPYAISNENYYRTYMALGDSVDISFSYSTGSTGGGYDAYLFRTNLTGDETQDQLMTKAKKLLLSGTTGNHIGGGWIYSAPVNFTLTETIRADDYGVGTYLFVCASFDTNEDYNLDSICTIAIHVVKDPVPLTGVEYYWCDQNGDNLTKIQKESTVSIALNGDTRYLCVQLLPENTTRRLKTLKSEFTDREDNVAFLFCTAQGNHIFAISPQLCGEGYVQAVIDSGDPGNLIYNAAFNVTVPCEAEETPRVMKEATCTEDGEKAYVCQKYIWGCDTIFSTQVIPATGHNWIFGAVSVEPTFEETGEVWYKCTNCHEVRREVVPTIDTPPEKPYKITNVVSGVHVYWNKVEGARKYGVWRSETGKDGTYKWLANPTVPHFTDTTAVSGKTYYYRITVLHTPTNTHSNKSEALGITFVSTPDITSRANTSKGIELGWNKISGATGYAIYRKVGSNAWSRVATISDNSTFTWLDTAVKSGNGTTYKYTIRALAGSNMGTLSGCRNAGRTMVRLFTPTISSCAAHATQSGTAFVRWNLNNRAHGYEVRFLLNGTVAKTYTVTNPQTVARSFSGLTEGKSYTVQVRSYFKTASAGTYYSAWSSPKSLTV